MLDGQKSPVTVFEPEIAGKRASKNISIARRDSTVYSYTVQPRHSEEHKMSEKKDFFSGIASKLTILMGGAVLFAGAQASANTVPVLSTGSNGISLDATSARKPLPAKLTLKQQVNGFKLIAAHGSHSSHASHASHSSHASRAA
jgi:hypothetical protein